jgi:hypothetical protein
VTFVVGAVARRLAFQTSDRLVSLAGEEYEALSNKNVVIRTSDALVCAGYSGIAYFGGTPTDRWIAETVWGADLGSGITMGGSELPNLWQAGERLRLGLARELQSRRLTGYFHEVLLTGLRIDRNNRIQPVLWSIKHPASNRGHVVLTRDGERNIADDRFQWAKTGMADPEVIRQMRGRLLDEGNDSPEAFEDVLIDAVKETGSAFPKQVGSDVMSIRLAFQRDGKVDVRATFSPSDPAADNLATYTPWMLLPGIVFSPAESRGDPEAAGWSTDHGTFKVRNLSGKPSRPFSWSPALRRPAPGR